ncbi:putative ribonuclease H-like domain-containing protein [Tanacetum coccineum]
MAHLVASITLDSTRSYVMQSAFLTQGTVSSIPIVFSWSGSISPEDFLSSVLLWLVIIVAVVDVRVMVVVVVESVVNFHYLDFPGRVYKVEKALYGLHQAPKAWYETLSIYLLYNEFQRGKIDKTLFIRRNKGDILLMIGFVYSKLSRLPPPTKITEPLKRSTWFKQLPLKYGSVFQPCHSVVDFDLFIVSLQCLIDEFSAIISPDVMNTRVQIPENNLDNLQSLREEDGTSKIVDPQDCLGSLELEVLDSTILTLLLEPTNLVAFGLLL